MNPQMNNPMNNQISMMDFQNQIVPNNQPNPVVAQMPQLSLQTPQTPQGIVGGGVAQNNSGTINQQKEFNVLSLCRVGQETVQDILSRFQDIFGILKSHSCPNGLTGSGPMSNDKRQKMQDQFRTIRLLFKRLRLLYEKCDNAEDYTQDVENLIPYVDDENKPPVVPTQSEDYQRTLIENRESTEILAQKNLQLKEIIDNMRNIIWEINSMMAARKS